ncbi:hypothetical protein BN946_scf184759.g24 [Trametes cinnabarina]|uniref:Uncharacterized protein n=1 Tax=Pycnoporus cinnabarinus TaxID=5643 RepID=A0A060SBB9_PYCCI|nr:hypothetical protein BN946_scf184759.g24 [Trametes cinnabarina]
MTIARSVLPSPALSACLPPRPLLARNASTQRPAPDHSASSKLFEDAAREEADQQHKSSTVSVLESQHQNWTGDEPIQHAVLRMLVDKYKPMRSGPIRTADETLRKAPPQVHTAPAPSENALPDVSAPSFSSTGGHSQVRTYVPGEPILPGIEGHKPWHTTFTVPSHASSSIRYGNIPPPRPARPSAPLPLDDKARRKERETKKRMEQGTRLSRARESTIDYRLGIKGAAAEQLRRPNPVSLKGWANLVEDRIELNSLVRKYNGMAPYAVRRPYYTRSVELERVYKEAAPDILAGLEERAKGTLGRRPGYAATAPADENDEAGGDGAGGSTIDWGGFSFRTMFREVVAAFRRR